jgi:hypothetical protein
VNIGLPAKPKKDVKAADFDQDWYDLQVFAWKEEATGIIKNNTCIAEGNRRMFAFFIEQCKPAMRTKLKETKGYDDAYKIQDGVKLLELIRGIMCGVEDHLQNTWAMMKSDKRLYTFFQRWNTTNDEYHDEFNAYVKVIESYGGKLLCTQGTSTQN